MRAPRLLTAVLTALLLGVSSGGRTAEQNLGYDPAADPFAQIEAAKGEAAERHKLILLVAGGDWCVWCHYLQAFIDSNADLRQSLEDTFVVVHANYSPENKNEAFFATLPKTSSYPHFWVLSSDGGVLRSQNTAFLEDGHDSYVKSRFLAFIERWKATLDR